MAMPSIGLYISTGGARNHEGYVCEMHTRTPLRALTQDEIGDEDIGSKRA